MSVPVDPSLPNGDNKTDFKCTLLILAIGQLKDMQDNTNDGDIQYELQSVLIKLDTLYKELTK
jgi:hypothetical protein